MLRWIGELVVSVAFGFAAAILPLFNNEAYAVAAGAAGLAAQVPVVVGLGLGNALGKTGMVWLLRQGRRLPWWRDRPAPPATSSRWRRLLDRLLELVGSRWGAVLVLLSAATSVPPLYPTTLAAAASRMRLVTFFLASGLGVTLRVAALFLLAARLG